MLFPSVRQVPHALLTRPPLSHPVRLTEVALLGASFDLHVLGTPPAFILSQDQTLVIKCLYPVQNRLAILFLLTVFRFVKSVDSTVLEKSLKEFSGLLSIV